MRPCSWSTAPCWMTATNWCGSPEYFDGDIALVQHTDTLREGEIGVFALDGEGIMKRYQKDGLYPINPDYEVIRPDENSTLRCFGRVLGKVTEDMLP